MVTIGKKYIPTVTPKKDDKRVSIDKCCGNCACINEAKDWCRFHQHSTRAGNYGCKTWLTQEELDAKLAEKQAMLDSKKAVRINYMLTLMFAMISASYHIIIRGEAMMGQLIGGKDWRRERKRALNDMMKDIKHIKTLYSTYFEQDYIQMMSDYGREDFDGYCYDGFQMFASDFLMLGLTYFEHGYRDNEVLHDIINYIRQKPVCLDLFSPEFVESFKIKGEDD